MPPLESRPGGSGPDTTERTALAVVAWAWVSASNRCRASDSSRSCCLSSSWSDREVAATPNAQRSSRCSAVSRQTVRIGQWSHNMTATARSLSCSLNQGWCEVGSEQWVRCPCAAMVSSALVNASFAWASASRRVMVLPPRSLSKSRLAKGSCCSAGRRKAWWRATGRRRTDVLRSGHLDLRSGHLLLH
jgi:hypothetical protein